MTDCKEPLQATVETAEELQKQQIHEDAMMDEDNEKMTAKETSELLTAVEEKEALVEELTNRCQRLQADFDNFRRRTRQEKEELSGFVMQDMILQILPVIDNLERALGGTEKQDAKAILAGVELIYRQLQGMLEKNGMQVIEALGTAFNPEEHQAVVREEDPEQPDGTIIAELQKGYRVRGRVVRPSMVKVVGNN